MNYVAKCYLDENGQPDTSKEGSDAVLTDIMLQYEAAHGQVNLTSLTHQERLISSGRMQWSLLTGLASPCLQWNVSSRAVIHMAMGF